ncbi:MAG: hypothetical protein AAGH72_09345 [Verrucomicrobiota bacterium]
MKEKQFNRSNTSGFIIDSYRPQNRIVCRYVEEINLKRSVTDPFGETKDYTITVFPEIKFQIELCDKGQLVVFDASKSLNQLMTALGSAVDFEISIKPCEFKLSRLNFLNKVFKPSSHRKNEVILDKIQFSEETFGVLKVASFQNPVHDIKKLIGTKNFEVKKIKLRSAYEGEEFSFEIFSTGRCLVNTESQDIALSFAREFIETHKLVS